MDSKVVNKLIRSQLWGLLRKQGFDTFETRSAFRYRGCFIDVVNFQSFNSHLASGLGCTTFSFAVNLGVYALGGRFDDRMRRDKRGRPLPDEAACLFRGNVEKRLPVDGFERPDIFFIDPEGRTAGPCFGELEDLFANALPVWFENFHDLDTVLEKVAGKDPVQLKTGIRFKSGLLPNIGSYNYWDLICTLRVLDLERAFSREKHQTAMCALEYLAEATVDISWPQDEAIYTEQRTNRIRFLLARIKAADKDLCFPAVDSTEISPQREEASISVPVTDNPDVARLECRRDIWPLLRRHGFTEFTERLAYRLCRDVIQVVQVAPVDPYEKRKSALPNGVFRVCIGVFWPELAENGLFRTSKDKPRPYATQCHVRMWLLPPSLPARSCTLFDSVDTAVQVLENNGLPWFERFGDPAACLKYFLGADLDRFVEYPMMRGLGGRHSSLRNMALAVFASRIDQPDETNRHLGEAGAALRERSPHHLRPRFENLLNQIKGRILDQT